MFRQLRGGLSAGVLALLAACGGGSGTGGDTVNHAPQALALASGDVEVSGTEVRAALGGAVRLDGSISTDPDRDALSHEWSLLSQPQGGNAPPSSSGAQLEWSPSAVGTYTYALKVSDGREKAMQVVSVAVTNQPPVASVTVAATFAAVATTAPEQQVTAGAAVLLDASASKDPDGDPVSVSFTLEARPSGSKAALVVADKQARFTTDLRGLYRVKVRGVDPSGAAFESTYSFRAGNRAPTPVVVATVNAVTATAGESSVDAAVGYDVLLTRRLSDPDGGVVTGAWQLAARPAGSAATLGAATGASTLLRPDVLGDYVVTLTATDAQGARSVYKTTVHVNNRSPEVSISTTTMSQPQASLLDVLLPVGTRVALRGDASLDADGDALSFAWTIEKQPAGSKAALSASNVASPTFTPDVEGTYTFKLRVTDQAGAYAERSVSLNVGSHAPVVLLERSNITVLPGRPVSLSAAPSYDEDGDALTYDWTLDAKPDASAATLKADSAATSFTPDVPGTYAAAVRVSDGHSRSVGYVTVRVLSEFGSSVKLSFVPGPALYSTGLDKVVLRMDSGTDGLGIVDPFVGSVRPVALPAPVLSFHLSPDGKLAVVMHQGKFSLIDVGAARLLKTIKVDSGRSDAFVTDAGVVFLIGGDQWVDEPVITMDGRTGAKIAQGSNWGGSYVSFFGTQMGVMAGRMNKVIFTSLGLSPQTIGSFTFDPVSSLVQETAAGYYSNNYGMSTPYYLSGDERLVFSSNGAYFSTSTLSYVGHLNGVTWLQSLSHSALNDEALVLPSASTLLSRYKRYTGTRLQPDTDMPLPKVGGEQSYGLAVFHSAAGSHVMLVQTGSSKPMDDSAAYYVVVR